MAYAPLMQGVGLLSRYTKLDAGRRDEAETLADLFIDEQFCAWDRTAWDGDNVPPRVENIARMVGEAEYLIRDVAASNPGAEPPSGPKAALKRAQMAAEQARDLGVLVGADGEELFPVKRSSRINVTVER